MTTQLQLKLKPKTKSINIRGIDHKLHTEFKALCAKRNESMRDRIIWLLQESIDRVNTFK